MVKFVFQKDFFKDKLVKLLEGVKLEFNLQVGKIIFFDFLEE